MLTIIHGDNLKDSREFYFQLRQKKTDAKILQGDKLTLTDVIEAVEGNGLFADTQDIFIELLLSKKQSKELDIFIDYLTKHIDASITLWEQKSLDKKLIRKFTKATIREFSYPSTLFQFLDSLSPHNAKRVLHLLAQTEQTVEIEVILFMLAKQTRILLALKDSSQTTISEVSILAPWQKDKLVRQAKQFSIEQLLFLHDKLFELDWQYKTGALTQSLPASLDFLLAGI